jgi:hypothetical protein
MRVLRVVVSGGPAKRARRLAGAATVLATVTVLTGCAQFDAALGQQQAIVSFRTGTTLSQKLAVRATCAKVPSVVPQAVPTDLKKYPYAFEQLTFQINHASDADVAQLETCLNKFPSAVAGVTLQDSSDEGN